LLTHGQHHEKNAIWSCCPDGAVLLAGDPPQDQRIRIILGGLSCPAESLQPIAAAVGTTSAIIPASAPAARPTGSPHSRAGISLRRRHGPVPDREKSQRKDQCGPKARSAAREMGDVRAAAGHELNEPGSCLTDRDEKFLAFPRPDRLQRTWSSFGLKDLPPPPIRLWRPGNCPDLVYTSGFGTIPLPFSVSWMPAGLMATRSGISAIRARLFSTSRFSTRGRLPFGRGGSDETTPRFQPISRQEKSCFAMQISSAKHG